MTQLQSSFESRFELMQLTDSRDTTAEDESYISQAEVAMSSRGASFNSIRPRRLRKQAFRLSVLCNHAYPYLCVGQATQHPAMFVTMLCVCRLF
ncbi:hypothetical protein VUR80DRAFT_2250 [Thermomyces stellatus]